MHTESKKTIGILGGGISALSLAYLLPKDTYQITILEKEDTLGGLARTFKKDGFLFDVGPHIIFAKEKHILDWMVRMLGKNKQKLFRRNFTYYKKQFIKYPFEHGLGQLPKEDAYECLCHFLFNKHKKKYPTNFKEWMYYVFGKGIAEKYLIPYNEKIWKCDPSELTLEWVGGRVPNPPAEDIIKSAIGIETEGYTHQLYFYYPLKGGAQALVQAISSKAERRQGKNLEILTRYEVTSIARDKGKWITKGRNGATHQFDILINTMPIHEFVRLSSFLKQRTKKDVKKLLYNSLVIVRIGLSTPPAKDKLAVYFPQPDILFHRITFNDFVSPNMSPKGKSSLLAEITFREGDAISKMSDSKIIAGTLRSLHNEKIINRAEVIFSDVYRVKYEYPVYDKNYSIYTKKIYQNMGEFNNLYCCGRFAEFRYINMNDCIKSAMEVAEKLKDRSEKRL